MSYTWSTGSIDMTSAGDKRSHAVSAQAFAAGMRAGAGRYKADCGEMVLPAGMYAPPGPRCLACTARQVREPERDRFSRLVAMVTMLPGLAEPSGRNRGSAT